MENGTMNGELTPESISEETKQEAESTKMKANEFYKGNNSTKMKLMKSKLTVRYNQFLYFEERSFCEVKIIAKFFGINLTLFCY